MYTAFLNPFKPGAGHMPPHLAGRNQEQEVFRKLLLQQAITDNLIISGLRGVGKTVLLESLKPIARQAGWLWVGDDFDEARSLSEERIADSIVTDLSLALAPLFTRRQVESGIGFSYKDEVTERPIDYQDLRQVYDRTNGLPSDKLKAVLRHVGDLMTGTQLKGIVFAYDEAQNLGDRSKDDQFPLSLLLNVFQSIQRSPGGLPFMLVLTGLPTLFPKLTEARTYSERMFEVALIDRLTEEEAVEAIKKPVEDADCKVKFAELTVRTIAAMSGGYPYFIQFICKEVYDAWAVKVGSGERATVPTGDIMRKLDQRFFSARWDNASDRQREFMRVAALLPHAGQSNKEFKVQDIVEGSHELLKKPFTIASCQMMLKTLIDNGFVFRNRRGKYSFAVPLLDEFILRDMGSSARLPAPFGDGGLAC